MAIRMGQIGTGHGHAAGKARSMRENPNVEFVGVYEADGARRAEAAGQPQWAGVRWHDTAASILGDPSIVAVAIEGRNDESLAMARMAIDAGKHLWYDKPAGDDWPAFQALIADARER